MISEDFLYYVALIAGSPWPLGRVRVWHDMGVIWGWQVKAIITGLMEWTDGRIEFAAEEPELNIQSVGQYRSYDSLVKREKSSLTLSWN